MVVCQIRDGEVAQDDNSCECLICERLKFGSDLDFSLKDGRN